MRDPQLLSCSFPRALERAEGMHGMHNSDAQRMVVSPGKTTILWSSLPRLLIDAPHNLVAVATRSIVTTSYVY